MSFSRASPWGLMKNLLLQKGLAAVQGVVLASFGAGRQVAQRGMRNFFLAIAFSWHD